MAEDENSILYVQTSEEHNRRCDTVVGAATLNDLALDAGATMWF